MTTDPTQITWPGSPPGPDPYDDRCWPSLDAEGRFADLWQAWDAWREGRLLEAELEHVAASHDLTAPILDDRNRPDWGHPAPSLAELARIALDHWPAAGSDAPDAVLGPEALFADEALLLAAVAGAAFIRTEDWAHNAFHIWTGQHPAPPVELRARIRAVELAPWAIWGATRRPDGRLDLENLSGLCRFYVPDGPVEVVGELAVHVGMAARVLRTDGGWVAHTVVPLTDLPHRRDIERWIRHETWLARTFQPGITRESLLRKRPILVRRALERAAYGQSPPAAVTSGP